MRRAFFAILLAATAAGVSAKEFTTLKGHGGPVMDIAVSPTGQVATASFDNSVGLWAGRDPQWLEGHDAAVKTVAFWGEHTLLSGGDDFSLRVWPGGDGTGQVLGQHKGPVAEITVSPDGQLVATASWDGSIGIWSATWDGTNGTSQFLTGHDQAVNTVAFSTDGSRLYSGSADGTIRLWDLQSGQETARLVNHGFGINQITLGPDDAWLAYGAVDGGTRVVDPLSGDRIADFTLDRRPVLAMAHHADTGRLAVGDGHGYIMMVDTERWKIARDFRATRRGPVWALAFSIDGATIYAGGLDDVAYAWPVATLDAFEPAIDGQRSFLRDADTMPNGERQFMRKCSICHALEAGPSRKAGPTLHGLFGRRAGTVTGYAYSPTLDGSAIVWSDETIDALFDEGPDHYIPGSKMPMQVITKSADRADLIAFLKRATAKE
ncbi:MAG: c-type cytochrome [Marinibacterium sp.]|nr:c-type cytochrome [Marinibacterium sp.]